jgi:molecular chaperone IbpA
MNGGCFKMATFDVSEMFRATPQGAPAYNILKTGEEEYRISLALPGWTREEIAVETRERTLWIKGERPVDPNHNQYLFKGIGMDEFQRAFELPEHVNVRNASLQHGMLHIDLVRELPEALRPRRIEIHSDAHIQPLLTEAAA